jgi:AraC family transcriptional regulator, exoenzyme S synthesis regulatory protein ExsA
MVKILPQLFYETPAYKKVLVDGLSCIVYKKLEQPVWHKEGYVSTPAITLVLKGLLRIETEDKLLAEVPENKMIFLPKGLYTISDILPSNGSFEAVVFFFDNSVIRNFVDSIKPKTNREKCVSHLVIDYASDIKVFVESLLHLYGGKEKNNPKLTAAKLFELLHLINAQQPTECFVMGMATLSNKERKGLREFMHTNFNKPLSIEDYAYLTGRTLSTFRRDFKTHFGGVSPKQWLIDRRLEKAYELLSENNTTITDVVAETGYENVPHFIKAFHKKYGLPPKQFLMQRRKELLMV